MSSLLLKLYTEDSENVHVQISFCLAFSAVNVFCYNISYLSCLHWPMKSIQGYYEFWKVTFSVYVCPVSLGVVCDSPAGTDHTASHCGAGHDVHVWGDTDQAGPHLYHLHHHESRIRRKSGASRQSQSKLTLSDTDTPDFMIHFCKIFNLNFR